MRRRSTAGLFYTIAADIARQQKQAEAARMRLQREAERQTKAAQREALRFERERVRAVKEFERQEKLYALTRREQGAADLNTEINIQLESLKCILSDALAVRNVISFENLRTHDAAPPLLVPKNLKEPKTHPNEADYYYLIAPPRGIKSLIPGNKRRYELAMEAAKQTFELALTHWQNEEANRIAELTALEVQHMQATDAFYAKQDEKNADVDAFEESYGTCEPNAVCFYHELVLNASDYPEDFPHRFELAYISASKQLVVEYELPGVSVVPTIAEYRFVKSTNTISGKPRKDGEIKETYQEIIASIALRTFHEIFNSDKKNYVETVCFNGYVRTVDPATGRDIQPHLISVRTTKERFDEIDLARVDKRICLKNLGAQVSRRPDEAQPVKPIVEFKMVDPRFVEQEDLVSGLSSAINLMDLNPYEFENLVANLFGQMGLESKLTRSSRDGGVDCVAYDSRPVLGGKVVIQAKRYRHTVGVSAVRDLFGTMMNEGANKGILVTTSGYGPDAFDFAKDKPIELIDGGGLLFLLQEVGVQARIVFPEEE